MISTVHMDGTVVIGEGEKDEAPMLFNGEQVGEGLGAKVDVAVDPIDGTTLTAKGMNNAISVVALAERGAMFDPSAVFYMEKIVCGPEAAGKIDIEAPVKVNLQRVADAKGVPINDLTVVVLDRPRHDQLSKDIREAGARIKFITDGDVAGAVMAARDDTGVDLLMGIGGTPEGIIAACAMKCLGGEIQGRLWARNDEEHRALAERGLSATQVLTTSDLVKGNDCFFAATGITDGELLHGVRFDRRVVRSQSIVMRSRSKTIRIINSEHPYSSIPDIKSKN
jgi:fructose-1,6-bisphosphatase II